MRGQLRCFDLLNKGKTKFVNIYLSIVMHSTIDHFFCIKQIK